MMKKLYRDKNDKMIAGVCSGIANYFGIDKTIVRLAVVILAICSFSGLFWVYLIAWMIIPADDNIIDN
ncbi:MAG: PspC domain-containing protein [Eubacterium sp.]|nr:PspC domain-containing protein [Eubacterium sp.]